MRVSMITSEVSLALRDIPIWDRSLAALTNRS